MRMLVWLGVVATAACGSVGPDEVRLLGRILDAEPVVEVPETVFVSMPFRVSIQTAGGGCTRAGETEVEVVGNRAVVIPYDYRLLYRACILIVIPIVHSTTVTFDGVGDGTIVFRGTGLGGAPVEFHYLVWVEKLAEELEG